MFDVQIGTRHARPLHVALKEIAATAKDPSSTNNPRVLREWRVLSGVWELQKLAEREGMQTSGRIQLDFDGDE